MATPALPSTAPARPDAAFLPDFCEQGNLLRTMLVAELLVFVIVAAQSGGWMVRLQGLALLSLFIQWVALVDIALLCVLRQWLARIDDRLAATLAFALLQAVTVVFTLLAHAVTGYMGLAIVTRPLGTMLAEHAVISAIVSAIALRYFYVTAQWRRQVVAEAQARVQALQARIRPHFLFNSMNTIASLTRSDPDQAEAAVEDLAELFRASLAERTFLSLAEELELVASYLRIEHQRLGGRLRVEWDCDEAAASAVEVPALTLQPLVENAVYHGIEQLAQGGTLTIETHRAADAVEIRVTNPVASSPSPARGHRMAQENVRQRLRLAFGEEATMHTRTSQGLYSATLRLPLAAGDADR